MKKSYQWHVLEGIAMCGVIALAAYLRLVNLQDNPYWYTDEATHLNIAHHLLEGRIQYMSVSQSTLFFARLPLFELILAACLKFFGNDILTLRTLTALLNTFSVGLVWVVVRRLSAFIRHQDDRLSIVQYRLLPLLAAFLFAMYPQAVLYSRFGFSYNLLTPLVLLTMLGLGEYHRTSQRGWLLMAVLSIGIGTTSDLMMFTMFVPTVLIISVKRWHDVFWAVGLGLIPFSIYVGFMLNYDAESFIFDVHFTATRLQGVPLPKQLGNMADNYTVLISQEFWFLGALMGLFVMPSSRLSKLGALMFITPIMMLGRIAALHGLSFYYLVPILPFVAIGMAGLLCYGVPRLWFYLVNTFQVVVEKWSWFPDRFSTPMIYQNVAMILSSLLVLFLMISPFFVTLNRDMEGVQTRWQTQIDPFLIDPDHARGVAEYINHGLKDGDRVVVSPAVAWLIDGDVIDFTVAPAQFVDDKVHFWGLTGKDAMPQHRFPYDPRYNNARYVVIDNLWYTWGIHHAEGAWEMVNDVQNRWIIVFETETITVYENPELSS